MTRWLMLVPTEFELQYLSPHCLEVVERTGGAIELCGFGPVVAAARTASLLASHKPEFVVLCGIAGALGAQVSVASACRFDAVACYGVGVGCGKDHRTASSIGWVQWKGAGESGARAQAIADVLELAPLPDGPGAGRKLLLTVCAASSDPCDAALKLAAYPLAIAEDMEGFAVAAACQLAGVPLHIVRGISNRAGDRAQHNWMVGEAMRAAMEIVEAIIGS
jgi:futalosine hydrolase